MPLRVAQGVLRSVALMCVNVTYASVLRTVGRCWQCQSRSFLHSGRMLKVRDQVHGSSSMCVLPSGKEAPPPLGKIIPHDEFHFISYFSYFLFEATFSAHSAPTFRSQRLCFNLYYMEGGLKSCKTGSHPDSK